MQEENFSPQDSLKLIQTMIAKTRRDMGANSNQFLLWGWVTFAGFIGQFILKNVFAYQKHYLVWLITFPTVFISIYLGNKQQRLQKVNTYLGDSMKYLWMGMGISFFVLSIIFSRMGWSNSVYPFFILFYGMGTFISGKFLQFVPLVIGGIAAWILAIGATYVTYDYQMLFAAAAILFSYIIPAYLMRQKNNSL
jgi:hypothetical protein